jgi:integrase
VLLYHGLRGSAERIHAYLEAACHGGEPAAPLFQPAKSRQGATRGAAITADGVYKSVLAYAAQAKIAIDGFGVHSLRATAATNALEHAADIAKVKVQEMARPRERRDHADLRPTQEPPRRDSPTFKVAY